MLVLIVYCFEIKLMLLVISINIKAMLNPALDVYIEPKARTIEVIDR